jgi:SAM-dependent methyltransferase
VLKRILHRLVAIPRIYDLVQWALGAGVTRERLAPYLRNTPAGAVVLELGAGTGNWADLVPPGARYVWLDNDPEKLQGFRAKRPHDLAVLGDGTALPFQNHAVDSILCVAVTHHVPNDGLPHLVDEMARVARERLIFVDAVDVPGRSVSSTLWKYDRGSYPRPDRALRQALERRFVLERTEIYSAYHSYLLCVASLSYL